MVQLLVNFVLSAAALYLAVFIHELMHLVGCLVLKVPFDRVYIGTKTKGNIRFWFKFGGVLFVFYLMPIGGGVKINTVLSLAEAWRIGVVALAGPIGGFLVSSALGGSVIFLTNNPNATYFAIWLLGLSAFINGFSLRNIRGCDGQTARVMLSGDESRIVTWLQVVNK